MRTYGFALAGRLIALLNNLLVIYLGSKYLSKSDQGMFYALTSMAAVQLMFELGFSTVLMQFVGHEKQVVGEGVGDLLRPVGKAAQNAKLQIIQVCEFADRWFRKAAALCFLGILTTAVFVFYGEPLQKWGIPSLVLACTVAVNLSLTGRWAVYEGCGFVREVLFARFVASLLTVLFATSFFLLDQGILVPAVAGFSASVAYVSCIGWKGKEFWRSLRGIESGISTIRNDFHEKVRALQFRTAISFVCGYFSFQCVTLISYKLGTSALAAKVGISMTIMLASISVAGMLIQIRRQKLFGLIAKNDLISYFDFGMKLRKHSLLVILTVAISGLIGMKLLDVFKLDWFIERLPSAWAFFFYMGCAAINQIIAVQSTLVRSFKVEPYVRHSIAVAVAVSLGAVLSAPSNSEVIFAGTYFFMNLFVAMPYATLIFRAERKKRLGLAQ